MGRYHHQTRHMGQLRQEFRQACQARDARCWLCGGHIDYLLRDGADAFELDHYYPVSLYPQYEEDPAGFRPSHRSCNRSRGNKPPTPRLGTSSRQWS